MKINKPDKIRKPRLKKSNKNILSHFVCDVCPKTKEESSLVDKSCLN